MMRPPPLALPRAGDQARFGPARTLDLRASFPTAARAVARAEPWLRERQMAKVGEGLVITGRGRGSPGGVGVVRGGVRNLLGLLKRRGGGAAVAGHTAGAFVVTVAPA